MDDTPVEIEAKMRLASPEALEARLRALGVGEPVDIFEVNTYFDKPDGALRQSDQGLRLRVEQRGGDVATTTNIITHKGPRRMGNVKTRPETELTVSDADAARRLLKALGYEPMLTFEKRRRRYRVEGCYIDIDTLPMIGTFVEVEGPDEETVLRVRATIGLDGEPLVRPSYASMLMDRLSQRARPVTYVRFE